jgi:HK97 family phage major capsid protein
METWKDKLGRANLLFEKAKVIAEKGDEATAEEKENLQTILDDAMKLKQSALQLKQITDGLEDQPPLERPEDEGEDGGDETKTHLQKGKGNQDSKGFEAWNNFLYAVWLHKAHGIPDKRLKWFEDKGPEGLEGKQMVGSTGARGGFLIPVQFLANMQAVMSEDALVRKFATIIRMTRRQVAIPVLDQTGALGAGLPNWFGGMRFYWKDETALKTETEAKFRRINLVAKKLIGYTNASDELLDDSAISLGDFLGGPLGFAGGIAWMEDYSFFMGVGGGQPRGVINAPVTLAPARNVAGQINYVDCINMLQQFLPSARGRWFVSQSAMASLIQMQGPAGNPSYVWQPNARDGVPGYLFGMPVHWTEKLPALGVRGDILLADWRYYLIGDRQATTVESSQYPRWEYDETSWRAVHRVDGQPWLSAPLTYQDATTQVSPFVVLGGVAS